EFFRAAVKDRRISEADKEIDFGWDGAARHFAIRVTPMLNESGIVVGTMLVFHDLTEIRRTEIAEASNKAKSKFFAMISHEIRTPMNAILGITEIKMQDDTLTSDIAEALSMIHSSGNILLNIINEVLDLSKIEAGKFQLVPVEYDAAGFINDTVQMNMSLAKDKPIEFKLHVDKNIPSILFGDSLRIRQIMSNLLSNAFKYTAEGIVELSFDVESDRGEAESKTTKPEVTLGFRVRDTGQGMTAEQIRALFDEYSRFNPQANREVEGTGLGMNITQHLIQLMNGNISVESEPGKGSLFTVRLPQGFKGSEFIGAELAENIEHFRWSHASRMKNAKIVYEPMPYGSILIVDDVEANLYVAKGLTKPYKLSVETASSGFEAVNKIKQGKAYDIIFMDHMMPKMDGIEATKIIRGMSYTQPIVALTANALVGQAQMFLENGFDDYLSKPIDTRNLDVLLNKLIRDKQPPEVVEAARAADARWGTSEKKSPVKGLQLLSKPRLLRAFMRDVEKAIATLNEIHKNSFRRDDDMEMYIISTHGIKSALASVGLIELSALALNLEQAGKTNNIAEMLSKTPLFIDGLQKLIEEIAPEPEEASKSL
ncbi:MAG: response regulator, partial [Treponema sp.]|nr:response regulator [Treponema sp.]